MYNIKPQDYYKRGLIFKYFKPFCEIDIQIVAVV